MYISISEQKKKKLMKKISQNPYYQIKISTHIANTLWQTLSGPHAQPWSWTNIKSQQKNKSNISYKTYPSSWKETG